MIRSQSGITSQLWKVCYRLSYIHGEGDWCVQFRHSDGMSRIVHAQYLHEPMVFRIMVRTRTFRISSHNAKMEVIIRDLSKNFYTPSISDLQNLAHLNDLFNAFGLLLWTFCRCHKGTGKTTREPIEFCSLSFHLESETVLQGVLKTYKLN